MSPRANCELPFACGRFSANDNFVSGKTGQVITLKLFYMDFAFSRFVNDSLDRVDHLARLKIVSLLSSGLVVFVFGGRGCGDRMQRLQLCRLVIYIAINVG